MSQMPAVDPTHSPSWFKRLMTSIALSGPGTWFYINVASRVDPWLIRVTRGHIDSALGVVPIVLLTSRGARSGLDRTVPLLYFTDGDDVVLMASSFGRARYPAWYHNLKANPEVSLYRRGHNGSYVAREVENTERDSLYDRATQLYAGYRLYEGRVAGVRRVPVLRLSPASRNP
jgi:deazaflavin-dependent oxidoreductase (nitroreductase family)